jgi:hypothetical protein
MAGDLTPKKDQILLYTTEDSDVKIDVFFQDETVWLTKKITDIYAQCSIDYDKNSPITREFYATVQNKLHWAITGRTSAEIIHTRVNANKIIWD